MDVSQQLIGLRSLVTKQQKEIEDMKVFTYQLYGLIAGLKNSVCMNDDTYIYEDEVNTYGSPARSLHDIQSDFEKEKDLMGVYNMIHKIGGDIHNIHVALHSQMDEIHDIDTTINDMLLTMQADQDAIMNNQQTMNFNQMYNKSLKTAKIVGGGTKFLGDIIGMIPVFGSSIKSVFDGVADGIGTVTDIASNEGVKYAAGLVSQMVIQTKDIAASYQLMGFHNKINASNDQKLDASSHLMTTIEEFNIKAYEANFHFKESPISDFEVDHPFGLYYMTPLKNNKVSKHYLGLLDKHLQTDHAPMIHNPSVIPTSNLCPAHAFVVITYPITKDRRRRIAFSTGAGSIGDEASLDVNQSIGSLLAGGRLKSNLIKHAWAEEDKVDGVFEDKLEPFFKSIGSGEFYEDGYARELFRFDINADFANMLAFTEQMQKYCPKYTLLHNNCQRQAKEMATFALTMCVPYWYKSGYTAERLYLKLKYKKEYGSTMFKNVTGTSADIHRYDPAPDPVPENQDKIDNYNRLKTKIYNRQHTHLESWLETHKDTIISTSTLPDHLSYHHAHEKLVSSPKDIVGLLKSSF